MVAKRLELHLNGAAWPLQASDGGASQVPNRRAGRPVEYQGDINSPLLSQGDRTRIQRRIVNRQAARRLRERQQDTLKHALCKVGYPVLLPPVLSHSNSRFLALDRCVH